MICGGTSLNKTSISFHNACIFVDVCRRLIIIPPQSCAGYAWAVRVCAVSHILVQYIHHHNTCTPRFAGLMNWSHILVWGHKWLGQYTYSQSQTTEVVLG